MRILEEDLMAKPIGRPMKYKHFITILDDETVYSPASIVRLGEKQGLIDPDLDEAQRKKERLRIRHTLARFSQNHQFSQEGDGLVMIKGQTPTRGWFGKRWKAALP